MNKLKSVITRLRRRSPRMLLPNVLANILILLVAIMAPQQAPVLLYKLGAVAAAGCLGYLLDCAAFPYGQPSGYLRVDWRDVDSFEDNNPDYAIVPGYERAYNVACLRRSAVICACMLAVALAL